MHAILLLVLILGLVFGSIQPAMAQTDDTVPATDFAACDNLTEEELRSELNTLSQSIFDQDGGIDLDAIVERQWQLHDMDTVVDAAVSDAVDVVQRDDELWNTFLSGWSPGKAEDLAQTVAIVAFDSETFRQALDDLSESIAADLEGQIAALSAESVTSNLVCLQQFIERNYSTIVVDAFEQGIRDSAGDIDVSASDQLDDGIMAVLSTHKTALGGVGVIIAAQISRKLVQRIGKVIARRAAGRVAGRLLGRAGAAVIPLAGWVIGGGLIIYDVIDSLDGALPQIEQSLQSAEAKQLIQDEIVLSIGPELRREMPQIAREISNDLYREWLDFRRQYRQLLAFADENPAFSELIAQHGNFAQSALLLDAMLVVLGADATGALIDDGTFAQFLTMPSSTVELLQATASPEAVIAWYELAGSDLEAVVALELPKLMMPQDLTRETLDRFLAIGDKAVIAKLAALNPAALASLDELSSTTLNELTVQLSAVELETLGAMLTGLESQRRNQLVSALQQNPNAMRLILENEAGAAVLASRDMTAAIAFLGTPADGYSIVMDGLNVANGSVSLRLFGAKYGGWTTAMLIGVPLLLVLAIVYSLVSLMARPFVGVYRLFAGKRR